jgi:hypothetical protein
LEEQVLRRYPRAKIHKRINKLYELSNVRFDLLLKHFIIKIVINKYWLYHLFAHHLTLIALIERVLVHFIDEKQENWVKEDQVLDCDLEDFLV